MAPRIDIKRMKSAYKGCIYHAAKRGIGWKLTFGEWSKIWLDSGHLFDRGNKRGQYVMGRFGDVGPYAVGNVKIITNQENLTDITPETEARRRAGIARFQTGQIRSPETRALMGDAKRDIPLTEEHCQNLSIAHQKPLSEKQMNGLRPYWDSLKGKKRDPSIGRKISNAKKGKVRISLEQRAQISEKLTGHKQSAETIAKRVATRARNKAAKKAKAEK